jgi:hypothetical protein
MSSYDYDDYHSITDDSEDLYTYDYDQWDDDDSETVEHSEWENYYHNITSELSEE